jgi:1-acyl-sn-glycerol-3-phosphate acyltransferase
MSFVNVIAIDRTNPERALRSMKRAREVMERGYSFGVFAEGTRALPGELLPFKKGAFYLALQTGSQIIPVAIRNTDRMMGKKTGVAFPGTIEMIIGPPVSTSDASERDIAQLITTTRDFICRELEPNESL